jgi:hypothetical protein
LIFCSKTRTTSCIKNGNSTKITWVDGAADANGMTNCRSTGKGSLHRQTQYCLQATHRIGEHFYAPQVLDMHHLLQGPGPQTRPHALSSKPQNFSVKDINP